MEKKTLFGRLETKLATNDTDTGTMDGYGAVFGNVDSYGDIIAPGAFTETLAEHKSNGTQPLMLLNHDLYSLPIGIWDDMSEDSTGLKCAGHFIDNNEGQNAYKTAKAGAINGLSIGFIVEQYQIIATIRVITKVRLIEVSLVTLPANDLARVSNVKSQENEMTDTNNSGGGAVGDLDRLEAIMAEAKAIIAKLEVKDGGDAEDGDDCNEDSDCEDGCQCNDEGECESKDSDASADAEETKYDEAAMSALSELRNFLKGRTQ